MLDSVNGRVGSAHVHFDNLDRLKYLAIDDNHEDGRLIAEEHFGKLDSANSAEDDLIMYRERAAQTAHRGRCLPPLGWEPPEKRAKRQANQETPKRKEKFAEELGRPDFPRDCRIKLVADDLFDAEIGRGSHDKTMGKK